MDHLLQSLSWQSTGQLCVLQSWDSFLAPVHSLASPTLGCATNRRRDRAPPSQETSQSLQASGS